MILIQTNKKSLKSTPKSLSYDPDQTIKISRAAVGFPRIGKKWFLLALSLPFVAGWVILLFLDDYEDDDDDD